MATDDASRPNVLVYGAGAVGAFLGGLLADSGCRVTLLGRANLGHSIRTHGLRVERPRTSRTVHPTLVASIDELDFAPDIVLLTTRAHSVAAALPELERVVSPGITLITMQNGVGIEDTIAKALPGKSLVAGSLTLSVESISTGHVRSTSRSGGIALAAVTGEADIETIARIFSDAGLRSSVHGDYRSMKWSKLLLNMMGNATAAILDWTPELIYAHPALFQLERAAVVEAITVIRAERSRLVSLPGFPVSLLPWIFRLPTSMGQMMLCSRVGGGRGDKPPSLQIDLRAGGRQTEARWLYGAVVEAGAKYDIPTPVNRRLMRVVEGVSRNVELRVAFRNRPQRLLRNIALAECPGSRSGTTGHQLPG